MWALLLTNVHLQSNIAIITLSKNVVPEKEKGHATAGGICKSSFFKYLYMDYCKKILHIRSLYLKGKINLDTTKARILPLLVEMNKIGACIAKRHGQKFYKLTFNYVLR